MENKLFIGNQQFFFIYLSKLLEIFEKIVYNYKKCPTRLLSEEGEKVWLKIYWEIIL